MSTIQLMKFFSWFKRRSLSVNLETNALPHKFGLNVKAAKLCANEPWGVLACGNGTFAVETYADPYIPGGHTVIGIFHTRAEADEVVRKHDADR